MSDIEFTRCAVCGALDLDRCPEHALRAIDNFTGEIVAKDPLEPPALWPDGRIVCACHEHTAAERRSAWVMHGFAEMYGTG